MGMQSIDISQNPLNKINIDVFHVSPTSKQREVQGSHKIFFSEIHNYQVKYYEKYLQIHSVARNVCVYHFPALRILIELIDLKSSTN